MTNSFSVRRSSRRLCSFLLVATMSAACAASAPATEEAPVPLEDPALAAPVGEVERTTFADDLNVVLLAMTRLPTGIYYRDIEEGNGVPAMPGREVLMTYVAYLSDGKEVDRTAPGARPLAFKVGEGQVIRGWDLGVRGMKTGGTRQLVVPSRYAYGSREVGKIPPNSVLVFVVRLDGVR
ncbi:MAG: FKBP-type peptidyl-prolyl cis-trans isomerase [Gemmatimonadaceae bacterium]|nr:FKBP-type peptidyl-prolyl cis-trans isomerase [Gemmatimonadaceae bacterium]